MSTLEDKLEAWLKYVAKQEQVMKDGDEPAEAERPAAAAPAPAAPAQYSPASTPTLAPAPPASIATVERAPSAGAHSEPEIPEVEDFLPMLRRRVTPPPVVEASAPPVEEKPSPFAARQLVPPPIPVRPMEQQPSENLRILTPIPPVVAEPKAAAPAPAPPTVEADLFAPQAPLTPMPVVKPVVKREQPKPKPVRMENKPVEPPSAMTSEGTQEMWDRLPRHVQLLVGLHPTEVAQRSYKQFKESREELVERLLDPTLSLEETARILNVCPTTVRRYTNREALKHLRTAGNQRRFRLSDVLAFMESQASKNTVEQ